MTIPQQDEIVARIQAYYGEVFDESALSAHLIGVGTVWGPVRR